MNNYIFVSKDGFTFSPANNESEPDIENLQVLGFEQGENAMEAFELFKDHNKQLSKQGFVHIECYNVTCETGSFNLI